MIGVVDEEILAVAQQFLGGEVDLQALDPNVLAGLTTPKHAGLVAALQRYAAEEGVECSVAVRHGETVAHLVEAISDEDCLVVVGVTEQRTTAIYHRVQALVRELGNPVLVV